MKDIINNIIENDSNANLCSFVSLQEETSMKTETDIYADQEQTFLETFAVVKGKMANGIPMTTAKEELMEDFIKDWVDLFGFDTI